MNQLSVTSIDGEVRSKLQKSIMSEICDRDMHPRNAIESPMPFEKNSTKHIKKINCSRTRYGIKYHHESKA